MLENLVGQDAAKSIIADIKNKNFPGAVLFAGNNATGKLTAALEVARVLSCTSPDHWKCECPSCLRHKALNCSNLLLMGPRDCSLEISAAKESFIKSYRDNDSHLKAVRYLFLRSVRKLTLRFSGILLEGDNSLSKIGPVIMQINENLEELDFPRELPPFDQTVKLCTEIEAAALKLETDFLYDSLPINQVRNMENWACIKADEGKKTIIIENADRMQTNVRNALLKILEEPPADCVFILLTTRRNAIMPTILSRVRTYTFKDRSLEYQQEVIKRVFHNDYFNGEINEYMLSYLPVPATKIREQSKMFFEGIVKGNLPDCSAVVKACNSFEPRVELKIFLNGIAECIRPIMNTQAGCEASSQVMKLLRECWDNVTMFNQSVNASLEILVRDLSRVNITFGKVFNRI